MNYSASKKIWKYCIRINHTISTFWDVVNVWICNYLELCLRADKTYRYNTKYFFEVSEMIIK